MLTKFADLAIAIEWRLLLTGMGLLCGPQQSTSNSSMTNRLTSLDIFTLVAIAISVVMLLLACWLIASAAGEMSRSDDMEHKLHGAPHCTRKAGPGRDSERDIWRRAG